MEDVGATSPLAYPSTPHRGISSFGTPNTPRTPRTATFVRTPYIQGTPGTPLGGGNRLSSQLNMDTQESDPSLSVRLIWGTTVNIHEAMTSFKNFLSNFTLAHRKRKMNELVEESDKQAFYPQLMDHVNVFWGALSRLYFLKNTHSVFFKKNRFIVQRR
jgi:DNA replication licensing factor MCM4